MNEQAETRNTGADGAGQPDHDTWEVPSRTLCVAAGIVGMISSLLWAWPEVLLLLAMGLAGGDPLAVAGAVINLVLGATSFVAAGLAMRARLRWLVVLIVLQSILLSLSVIPAVIHRALPLLLMPALATVILAALAIPEAMRYRREGLEL